MGEEYRWVAGKISRVQFSTVRNRDILQNSGIQSAPMSRAAGAVSAAGHSDFHSHFTSLTPTPVWCQFFTIQTYMFQPARSSSSTIWWQERGHPSQEDQWGKTMEKKTPVKWDADLWLYYHYNYDVIVIITVNHCNMIIWRERSVDIKQKTSLVP